MTKQEELKAEIKELETKLKALETKLKALQAKDDREREERRKSVKRKYKFTITPVESRTYQKIWDQSCKWYRLTGEVANKEELYTVGYYNDEQCLQGGCMDYLFNSVSGRIICYGYGGGGTMYIPEDSCGRKRPEEITYEQFRVGIQNETQRIYDAIGTFLLGHPEGGDVSEIVNSHKFTWL